METNNVYVIPNNNINLINTNRHKCSFCHCEGHNITTCNSTVLSSINNYLIYSKSEYLILHNDNRLLSIQAFENYLYDFCSQSENNLKLIKFVACRFYNVRLRSMIQIAINQILLRLYDIDIAWLTFHEYNFVPFNENTPVRISNILNGILLNYAANEYMNNTNFNTNIIFTDYQIKLKKIHDNNDNIECSICYNTVNKKNCASLDCNHEYCIDCVKQLINKKHKNCPYCRENIKNITCCNEENYNKLSELSELSELSI